MVARWSFTAALGAACLLAVALATSPQGFAAEATDTAETQSADETPPAPAEIAEEATEKAAEEAYVVSDVLVSVQALSKIAVPENAVLVIEFRRQDGLAGRLPARTDFEMAYRHDGQFSLVVTVDRQATYDVTATVALDGNTFLSGQSSLTGDEITNGFELTLR